MKRAALLVIVALLGALSGCAQSERRLSPLPSPPLATRRPPPPPQPRPQPTPRPAPPPLVQKPAPAPAPTARLNGAELTPPGGITPGKWQTVVVHHSASNRDTPQGMDAYHRVSRGWENGLGYHFVIGNGVNYPDGKIFVGPRWKKQIQGAHCGVPAGTYFGVRRPKNYFNEHGIGICLIGDLEGGQPTSRQLATLEQLTSWLCGQTGVRASQIYGHGQVKQTECPGRNMRPRLAGLRRTVAASLALGDDLPLIEEWGDEFVLLSEPVESSLMGPVLPSPCDCGALHADTTDLARLDFGFGFASN